MAYHTIIAFNTEKGLHAYQAEEDCTPNITNWLLEDHDDLETEIKAKIAIARTNLIDKYNIEEI